MVFLCQSVRSISCMPHSITCDRKQRMNISTSNMNIFHIKRIISFLQKKILQWNRLIFIQHKVHMKLRSRQRADWQFSHTSSSLASKYCRYCWGRTSLKPSKKACVCSSTPLDSLHSATSLQGETHTQTLKLHPIKLKKKTTRHNLMREFWKWLIVFFDKPTWCTPPCSPQWLGCLLLLVSAHGWRFPPGSLCQRRRTSPDNTPQCRYP